MKVTANMRRIVMALFPSLAGEISVLLTERETLQVFKMRVKIESRRIRKRKARCEPDLCDLAQIV